jgi:uncharacterized protein
MLERLPVVVDPLRLAHQAEQLRGRVPLAEMERLAKVVHSAAGEAWADLHFGTDEEGHAYLAGRVRADVTLICQRCLEPVVLHLDRELRLGLVADLAAADGLPDRYDVLVVDPRPMRLAAIVEDELLLALPIVPMHPRDQCPAGEYVAAGEEAAEADAPARPSPFAALAELKDRGRR